MPFNEALVESITGAIPPWLAVVVFLLSYLGSIYVIAPGVMAAYIWGDRRRTATWLGIVIAAYASFVFAKALIDTPRPDVEPPLAREVVPALLVPLYDLAVDFETGSFPSGHAVAVAVFWGLVTLDINWSTLGRRLLVGATVVALSGFSRVALGVHYVEDVIGGILVALVLLAVMLGVRERVADPVTAMLALALVPITGAALVGELVEAGALLLVVLVAYAAHATIQEEQPTVPLVGE